MRCVLPEAPAGAIAHIAAICKLHLQRNSYLHDARVFTAEVSADGTFVFDDVPAELHSNRSAAHSKLEEFEQALRDADACVRLRPEWGKAHGRRGHALQGLRRFDEAKQSYEAALKLDPGNKVRSSLCACHQARNYHCSSRAGCAAGAGGMRCDHGDRAARGDVGRGERRRHGGDGGMAGRLRPRGRAE